MPLHAAPPKGWAKHLSPFLGGLLYTPLPSPLTPYKEKADSPTCLLSKQETVACSPSLLPQQGPLQSLPEFLGWPLTNSFKEAKSPGQ